MIQVANEEEKWSSVKLGATKFFQARHGGRPTESDTGCRMLDITNGATEQLKSIPKSSQEFTVANLDDTFIFVMGGGSESRSTIRIDSSSYRYSLQTQEWEEIVSMNQARQGASSCSLNGDVYVFCGIT